MRSTTLSTLFFALFALLSGVLFPKYMLLINLTFFTAVTYAVPVPPQGEIIKRACAMGGCRDAVNVGSVSACMRIA